MDSIMKNVQTICSWIKEKMNHIAFKAIYYVLNNQGV